MIIISHRQAQEIIRKALDNRPDESQRLPPEQWDALQAHLEICPACQLYEVKQKESEKNLRRLLDNRWRAIDIDQQIDLSRTIIHSRKERNQNRVWKKKGLIGLIIVITLLIIFLVNPLSRKNPSLTHQTIEPGLSETAGNGFNLLSDPTPMPLFRGVIAYQTTQNGSSAIYLLNVTGNSNGPDQMSLAQNQASNEAPAWSPDGEWLAFLSSSRDKRDQLKKSEIYLMNIAGTRITQITDVPSVIWLGSLSWSPDGKSIALVGQRMDKGKLPNVYLISTDRPASIIDGVHRLPDTENVEGPVQFSRNRSILGYWMDGAWEGQNLETGDRFQFGQENERVQSREFQWHRNGYSIVYGFQTLQSSVKTFKITLGLSGMLNETLYTFQKNQTEDPTRTRSISPSPVNGQIAFLQDADGDNCWTMHFIGDHEGDVLSREIQDLCIDRPIDPSSWTSDGQWIVVFAHPLGKDQGAIYAIPTQPKPIGQPFERLIGLSKVDTGVVLAVRQNQNRSILNIQPFPAPPVPSPQPPTVLTESLPGQILINPQEPAGSPAERANLLLFDLRSKRWEQIQLPEDTHSFPLCPRLSPDRKQIAYLYQNSNDVQVTVITTSGKIVFQRTIPDITIFLDLPSCPVWSPDGKHFAVRVNTREGTILMVTPIDSNSNPIRLDFKRIPGIFDFIWTADSQRIIIGLNHLPGNSYPSSTQLIEWSIDQPTSTHSFQTENPYQIRATFEGNAFILRTALSPDGKHLALMVGQKLNIELQILDAVTFNELDRMVIQPSNNLTYQEQLQTSLAWLSNADVAFTRNSAPTGIYEYEIATYNLTTNETHILFQSQDRMINPVWSPDGKWMVYGSEEDVRLLDIDYDLAPLILSQSKIINLDWK